MHNRSAGAPAQITQELCSRSLPSCRDTNLSIIRAMWTPQLTVTTGIVAHCEPDRYHGQQCIKRDTEGVIEGGTK